MPAASPGAAGTLPNDYPADQKTLVDQAAQRYNIPAWVLQGVWGMETSFGQNVATSSAGAEGDFQFIPSTAKIYGYPMTNTPSAAQFTAQANDAAAYLAKLFQGTGSWDAALRSYSGGGYGASQVQAKAQSAGFNQSTGPNIPAAISSAANAVGSAVSSVPDAINSIGTDISSVWSAITNPHNWLRALEILGAVIAIYFGLKSLTGAPGVTTIAEKVPVKP